MPGGEVFSFEQQAVAACFGEPVHGFEVFGGHGDALFFCGISVGIIQAAAVVRVEEAAGDPGVYNFVRIFVLQFVKAAQAAAGTDGFPLLGSHLSEGCVLPEGSFC